ncbi:hypothetical protein GIB67_034328 [Kingdonia uniflora]|uniref:RING-type E3 ubiquitin transferase n=1 Tax=Kingdonia uniflora TaxID=39325 RepID=A0A7J7NRX5_9MAGN|nr:hypothetical protein GIB67_034328 [Kingdonia uniflora]
MDETMKTESHLTSAAAFVEGGVQEACDDTCSICLESFDCDPSTVTSCKHEFHLQCILEWCQRSSQCPMCWQPISLKDPTSQELFEGVERERSVRMRPQRNATIFHHPTLGDFELQHLPVGVNDSELEERIIQHLAAAAAMGRAHHIARREGQRSRSTAQGRPQFLVFSSHPNAPTGPSSASLAEIGGDDQPPAITTTGPSVPLTALAEPSQGASWPSSLTSEIPTSASGSSSITANHHGLSFNNRTPSSPSPVGQDRAGPSEFQSFSESLKSRLGAVSTRYKESISKSTRGWKEKLFSRNTANFDIGSDLRREVTAGIASVSRLMERLETRENSRVDSSSVPSNLEDDSVMDHGNQRVAENPSNNLNDTTTSSSSAASSGLI